MTYVLQIKLVNKETVCSSILLGMPRVISHGSVEKVVTGDVKKTGIFLLTYTAWTLRSSSSGRQC